MGKWLLIAFVVAGLTAVGQAQARGGFGGFHNGGRFGVGPGFAGGHGYFGRNVFLADAFWYSDYPAQPQLYELSTLPVLVVQPRTAPPLAERKPEPLMIEWQGDKYVRFSGQRDSSPLDYSERARDTLTAGDQLRQAPTQVDLPEVVLVFRDGHREEVADYVIANGSLYARGNYWRDGYWTKTVQLSSLDIPGTLHTNSEAGVKFVLPSSPNEVITRP